jgi:hypothetical protein
VIPGLEGEFDSSPGFIFNIPRHELLVVQPEERFKFGPGLDRDYGSVLQPHLVE